MTRLAALALVLVLGLTTTPAVALTTYYVAPNSTTAHTGAAATPWASLADSGAWTRINNTLATDDVTVYFTARKAASDTNETTTSQIAIGRTDASTHRLTLDGMSQYSTSNSSPSWASYSGLSRFQITSSAPINSNNFSSPFPARDYITIRGFRLISTGQIAPLQNMSNLIFEYNEGSAQAGASVGPGVGTGKATDTDPSTPSHIIIRFNTIHDTRGECIYIGGGSPDPPGPGTPTNSGDDILIQGNILYNCAAFSDQGDGIDVKDGHTNLRIINNVITYPNRSANCDCHCIVVESADLIDGNYCEHPAHNGILLSAAWNTPVGRNQLIIRNNIIVNTDGGDAIQLGEANSTAYQWANVKVYNNSVFKSAGSCVAVHSPDANVTVQNNIFHTCASGVNSQASGQVTAHDYNIFFNVGNALALGGTNTTCANIPTVETHSKCFDPKFVNTTVPYADTHFTLQTGSPAIGVGLNLSATFTVDYGGATRVAPWDLGASAASTVGKEPSPPTQTRVSRLRFYWR